MKKPTFSFEFFPPKTDAGRAELIETARKMAALGPSFMTVTYGAGGSTRQWTMEAAIRIQTLTGVPTAAHLTCVNTMKGGIHEIAESLWTEGIRHIVALRGDVPKIDMPLDYNNDDYYHYANELVVGLKTLHDFEISVAAYPEKHPDAPDLETDIARLKKKCEAGAARAITQFFFDNDTYFRFLDKTRAAGIETPVLPGVLPVVNYEKMLSFAGSCRTNVPDWLRARFESAAPEDHALIAQEIIVEQCRRLIEGGVPHIHFYTLNRMDLTAAACAVLA